MPNRILKENICTSDDFNDLTWFEQSVFTRLIVTVDDYGRTDARPAVLRGKMFPLSNVSDKQIHEALLKLSDMNMVTLYKVSGKPYLYLTSWMDHQSPRAKVSKYPAPEEADDINCEHMQADENICKQMQADAPDIRYSNSYSINDIRYSEEKRKRFTPPTLDQIIAYCDEKNLTVDPQQFFDFFDAGDWKDSKGNKVKNWKQKILTWEKYQSDKPKKPEAKPKPVSFMDLTWEDEVIYES